MDLGPGMRRPSVSLSMEETFGAEINESFEMGPEDAAEQVLILRRASKVSSIAGVSDDDDTQSVNSPVFRKTSAVQKRASLTASQKKFPVDKFSLERRRKPRKKHSSSSLSRSVEEDVSGESEAERSMEEEELSQISRRAATTITLGPRSFFLHVRHFTPPANTVKVSLIATLWNDKGERMTKPVTLSNCKDMGCKGMCAFHLVGSLKLDGSIVDRGRVGYVQLRKRFPFNLLRRAATADLFIQDVYLKRDVAVSPDQDILAYFRFQGYVQDGALVTIRNLLAVIGTGRNDAALTVITSHSSNKHRHIQDRLLPPLEWAPQDTALPQSTTTSPLAQAKTYVRNGLLMFEFNHYATSETKPLILNQGLQTFMDVARYRGTPGFIPTYPPRDHTFSGIKFAQFSQDNVAQGPLDYIQQLLWATPTDVAHNALKLCYLDFTPFLQASMKISQTQREIDECRRIVAYYDTDEELARQYLEGLFCTHLRMLRQPRDLGPTHAPRAAGHHPFVSLIRQETPMSFKWVSDMVLQANPSHNFNLHRVFFVDYSHLCGIPTNSAIPAYFAPARAVFILNPKGILHPLAIALYDEALMTWHTHLPSHTTWAVAKLFLKCAAGQEHQLVSHALQTHLVVEPFSIALERKVPLHHILYRVLKPHFRYTLDINFKAKTTLLTKEGRMDVVMATAGPDAGHLTFLLRNVREWDFSQMVLPDELKRRGFDTSPLATEFELPGYLFAHDGMQFWTALEEWLTSVVTTAYLTEDDYSSDEIAYAFFAEVQAQGFPNNPSFHPTTREELIRVLCGIVYTSTVSHAAVNFPQFAHYSFIANSPLVLSKLPPKPDTPCDVSQYLSLGFRQIKNTVKTAWGLSRFVLNDERFMLRGEGAHFFNLSLWNDSKFRDACEKLETRMQALEKLILARPKSTYGTRYLWLLPSSIPTSITT